MRRLGLTLLGSVLLWPLRVESQEVRTPSTALEFTAGIGLGLGGPGYTTRLSGTLDAALVRRIRNVRWLDRVGIAAGLDGLRTPKPFSSSIPFPATMSVSLVGGGAWPVGNQQELRLLAGPAVIRVLDATGLIARDRGGLQARLDLVRRSRNRWFALAARGAWFSSAGDHPVTLFGFGVAVHF